MQSFLENILLLMKKSLKCKFIYFVAAILVCKCHKYANISGRYFYFQTKGALNASLLIMLQFLHLFSFVCTIFSYINKNILLKNMKQNFGKDALISRILDLWHRQNLLEILNAVPMRNTIKVSANSVSAGSWEQSDLYSKLLRKGHHLTSQGKIATVLVLKESIEIERSSNLSLVNSERDKNACLLVKTLLYDDQRFIKVIFWHDLS